MAIKFDFYETPQPDKGIVAGGKKKYHARVVESGKLGMKEIVENISHRCTLSDGDIHGVIVELANEIRQGLRAGERVNLPGIGQFYLTLSAPEDADPKKTHSQSIEIKNVEFKPDKLFKQRLQAEAAFERIPQKIHSAGISEEEIDQRLTEYYKKHYYISRACFAEMCGFTKATAIRYLKNMVEQGKIVNTGTPSHPNYEPGKGWYGKE